MKQPINKLQRLIDKLKAKRKEPSFLDQKRIKSYASAIEILELYNHKYYDGKDLDANISFIKNEVYKFFNLSPEFVESKTQKREAVQARQIIMSIVFAITKKGLAIIGKKTFGKDHTTVLHSKRTVRNLIDTEPKYREDFILICNKIKREFKIIYKDLY